VFIAIILSGCVIILSFQTKIDAITLALKGFGFF
jgi:hypothetical protein